MNHDKYRRLMKIENARALDKAKRKRDANETEMEMDETERDED